MNTGKSIKISGVNHQTISFLSLWRKLQESDRNNIRQYRLYSKGLIFLTEDDANSLRMEIICELADLILEAIYNIPSDDMCNEDGSFYEEYQDHFNDIYDEIEDRLLNNEL